jgi:hypothetical protein
MFWFCHSITVLPIPIDYVLFLIGLLYFNWNIYLFSVCYAWFQHWTGAFSGNFCVLKRRHCVVGTWVFGLDCFIIILILVGRLNSELPPLDKVQFWQYCTLHWTFIEIFMFITFRIECNWLFIFQMWWIYILIYASGILTHLLTVNGQYTYIVWYFIVLGVYQHKRKRSFTTKPFPPKCFIYKSQS